MKLTGLRLLVAISACLAGAVCTDAATSPRYGGTLRVELRLSSVTFDPRQWKAGSSDSAAGEKLASLLFDRLVVLDNYGRIQPQLATDWSHDTAFKRWQFTIRSGVKFSDGSALTAADMVAALQPLLRANLSILASENSVIIQSQSPAPDLLEEISSGRYFIYRVQPDGRLLGTGPFFVAESAAPPPDGRVTFYKLAANESCWAGKPFLDGIELTLNVPALRALFDLQLGRADLIDLAPELVRRATQDNLRVWSSDPLRLFALRFDETQPVASDPKLREALSFSLDRYTMAGVLLQKQAQPAAALLPQWLSGYAFLFAVETNLNRAKEIRTALPANVAAGADPLHLRVDAASDIAKLLGERVKVNARQASIAVQVSTRPASRAGAQSAPNGENAASDPPAGLHLVEWHYSFLSPRAELESLVSTLLPAAAGDAANAGAAPGQLYTVEKRLLDARRILPLVALPEFVGVGRDVRNWSPSRWADWHLDQAWLDRPEIPAEHSSIQLPTNEPAASSLKTQQQPAAANGARP